jgi:hypothetical protein
VLSDYPVLNSLYRISEFPPIDIRIEEVEINHFDSIRLRGILPFGPLANMTRFSKRYRELFTVT